MNTQGNKLDRPLIKANVRDLDAHEGKAEEHAENEIESAYGSMGSRVDDRDENDWSLSPSYLPFSLLGG